jgi:hypothetical protein
MNSSPSLSSSTTLRVTFSSFSKVLKKTFTNIEFHRSMDDARLRALALNWQIASVEAVPAGKEVAE